MPDETPRFMIYQALDSARSLQRHINQLSMDEVMAALQLEANTARRKAMLVRLIRRATRLYEKQIATELKEKFLPHPPSAIMKPPAVKAKPAKKKAAKKKKAAAPKRKREA